MEQRKISSNQQGPGLLRPSSQLKQQPSAQPTKDKESTDGQYGGRRVTRDREILHRSGIDVASKSGAATTNFSQSQSKPGGNTRSPAGATSKNTVATSGNVPTESSSSIGGRGNNGVPNGLASNSLGGVRAAPTQLIGAHKALDRLPQQTEDEFLRGCGFQGIWSENFEVSGLMNSVVKLCKLAPTQGDDEWQDANLNFAHLLGLCKGRLGRHHCLLQSRLQDVEGLLDLEEKIEGQIQQYQEGIVTARGELEVARTICKHREELDVLCGEVLKKPCLEMTNRLESTEAYCRGRAETKTEEIMAKIATKRKQVEAALHAADDLFENPTCETAKS